MLLLALLLAATPHPATAEEAARYPWLKAGAPVRTLEESFAPPEGYRRVALPEGSFGAWLRTLPLRAEGQPVRAFDGSEIVAAGDPRVAAVAELDVGSRDLQQCADSIIRLHAEWLWSRGKAAEARYKLTSGDEAAWARWAAGDRAVVGRRKVTWARSAAPDRSRASFRSYLDLVFTYAGTLSLSAYSPKVERAKLQPGDFFVLPAKKDTGHAVLVLDLAEDAKGRRVALLGQGYMPAQDFQVLARDGSPWFDLSGDEVATPFWAPFPWSSVRRLAP